jgi:uncharacterized protein YqjF (DUF2071 family)
MLNYEVEPNLLNRYVPPGTFLDSFNGRTYLSLVGFRFCHTKLLGHLAVPFHADFEEVNLRFYVRRKDGVEDRGEELFSSPRSCPDAQSRQLLVWYTGRTIRAFQ